MKTLIIMVLVAALVGVAYLSRPSQKSFEVMIREQANAQAGPSPVGAIANEIAANLGLKEVTYKDRWLWVDVQKEGKTVYTGAFGHWFQWGKVYEAPATGSTPVKVPGVS